MRKTVLEMGFNAFSGLHGGLVLFEKIYLNPRSRNRTYMMKNHFRNGFAIYGSNASWIYMGFSAIERLT
jgi:hypothetical protein